MEQVLAFLPVPDLCKYRSVCKRWNSLICSPEFGTRCIQNATKGVIKGECFVVNLRFCIQSAQSGARRKEISSWSIFDLDTRRWYNVEDTLPKVFDFHVSAMAAGLVCTFGITLSNIQSSVSWDRGQTLVVSNLIGKSMRVLPNPPVYVNFHEANLKLVVHDVSQAYKIFLISVSIFWRPTEDRCMCVYDSTTDQWRMSPNPPLGHCSIIEHDRIVLNAVYEGVLYVLCSGQNSFVRGLYSYNDFAHSWEDTGVKFGQDRVIMIEYCDLVVSNNRLFLVNQCLMDQSLVDQRYWPDIMKFPKHWTNKPFWPLDISEISLSEKHCTTVVQMTKAELFEQLDIPAPTNDRCEFKCDNGIRADGFGNFILLMTKKVHGKIGKYVLYNLVTGLWEVLPPNPVERLHFEDGYHGSLRRDGKYVAAYLRLPNTPC